MATQIANCTVKRWSWQGRVQENRQGHQGLVKRLPGLSSPRFLWLALLAWLIPSPHAAKAGPSGVDWVASGQVADAENRHPVLGALLRCHRPDGRAIAPIHATASGTFRVGPPDTQGVSHLRCEFSADGYEGVQLTVSGSDAPSELHVTMRKRRELRITGLTVLPAPATASGSGAKDQLQFFVKNETDQKIGVQSLQLRLRVKVGDCLDLSPGFVLSIDQGLSKDAPLIGRLTAEGLKEPLDVPLTGTIAELPCHQQEATLLMKVLFAFDPKEHRKLAIALPRSFTLAKGVHELSLVRATTITLDFKSGDTVLATDSLQQ